MLTLLTLLLAAPLPPRKAPPPPPAPAVYLCAWGAGDAPTLYRMALHPGGRYECRRADADAAAPPALTGEWRQEGLTLHVRERHADAAPGVWNYYWSVGPGGSGQLLSDGTLDATPIELWPLEAK